MFEITFKYVGQGDSIIIEWGSDDTHLGIIDCKKNEGANPIINHLRGLDIDVIDFMFLSHPHRDHYSGFDELLEYCERNDINIKLFGFTTDITRAYLESILIPKEAKRKLANIYRKAHDLDQKGIITRRGLVDDFSSSLKLNDKLFLRILAPSQNEKDEYYQSLFDENIKIKDKPDANFVSLITSIESEEYQFLLTSDAEISVLRRIGIKVLKNFDKELLLGQVPHHGSEKNHYREFWKKRNYSTNTPLAISVGPNKYGHPSRSVVSELEELDYNVEITDPTILQEREPKIGLNLISQRINTDSNPADINFEFDTSSL